MTIKHVEITNWERPGDRWWDDVSDKPDEPLIEATIQFTLSWNEYQELLTDARGWKSAKYERKT